MKKKIRKQTREKYLVKELIKEKDTTEFQKDVLNVYLKSLK